MNLSDTSSIATIALGTVTVLAWLWKLLTWFRKRHAETKELAIEGDRLAQQILGNATSPAKRADIHLFVTLRAIEFNTHQTQSTIWTFGMSFMIVILSIFFVIISKFLDIDYSHPLIIVFILSFTTLLASFFMAIWFSFHLKRIEKGWESGTMKVIEQKLARHLPDA